MLDRLGHSLAALLLLGACSAQDQDLPTVAHDREGDYRQAARLRGQAFAAVEANDWSTAIEALTAIGDLLPGNLLPLVNLAVCHQQAGDTAAAKAAALAVAEVAPDHPVLLYATAHIQRDGGDAAWRESLERFTSAHPQDVRPYFLLQRWLSEDGDFTAAYRAAEQAARREPENLVILVDRLVAATAALLGDESLEAIDAVEDRLDGFEGQLLAFADEIRHALDAGSASLGPPAQVIRNILRPTGLYRQHLIPLVGAGSVGRGYFLQLDFDPPLPKTIQGGQDIELAFVDATAAEGLEATGVGGPLLAASLPAHDEILLSSAGALTRLRRSEQRWIAEPEAGGRDLGTAWARLDVDQDGLDDLLTEHQGRLWLHPGGQPDPTAIYNLGEPLTGVFPLDADHDGDLDIVAVTRSLARYLVNDGAGGWRPDDAALSDLAGRTVTDLVSADFDDDGDLDVIAAADGRLLLLSNTRLGRLEDVSEAFELDTLEIAEARLAVEDFDGNGQFDLLAWDIQGSSLLLNDGSAFTPAPLPEGRGAGWRAAAAADFDNDGDRDVVAVTVEGRVLLLRNTREAFSLETLTLPGVGVDQLLPGDYDGDGDLDLMARAPSGPRYWRNDGGSLNHWLRLRLRGKNENNSKNNSQGLFVKIESRVAEHYQAALGNGRVNHLGLGAFRQADVLRVVWTNGLAQTWAALAADQVLDEEQVLKGSCPFLYTWNGERFEFVTDLMWKSPLGMILGDGSPAPHQSARDFVLIPGERLQPVDGELWLQVTEELWEAVYVDRQRLLAIDYPERLDLVVDEKFTRPPHPSEPVMHWVDRLLKPDAARDDRGRDMLERISSRDGRHVDGLPLSRHQGVTDGHSLELDFTLVPEGKALRLILHGWIFPTDTSINFALAQSGGGPAPPRLELKDAGGRWRTLLESISFPSGKNKAVVVDLTDRLPAGDVTLRLTTGMQIYWDSAILAIGRPTVRPVITALEPGQSDLHYRGFSRLYRTSDSGPHLFDYDDVDTTPRFRDLSGLYTAYGPVDELLAGEDDRYVVMNAGDELTVRYQAAGLPNLPAGWRRDYVLYTDGWVKDGDIHTSHSQTVAPLPYHAMNAYPNLPRHRFPRSPEHESWRVNYQTRWVDDRPFRGAVQRGPGQR